MAILLAGAGLVLGLVLLTGRTASGPNAGGVPRAVAEDTVPTSPTSPSQTAPPPAPDTAPAPAAPASPAPPPPAAPALRRYARTWVNVRSGRSGTAPGIRVLSPGDTVLVDSLRRGWYRVLVNGRPQGYVDRTYLDTVPPLARP